MYGGNHHVSFFDHFGIVLDNAEGVYFAGQEIAGKVVIECREPRRISEVLLELKGRARTHWTKSRKTCSANETYFCEQFNTEYVRKLPETEAHNDGKGTGEGGAAAARPRRESVKIMGRLLHAGTHEIPFSYTLPKGLPSSFEGDFGFVRYTCRAICESPWDFDTVCFLPFTVVGIEDLNHEAELSLPLETHCAHSIGAFCLRLGSVNVELRLANGGLTPGQKVPAYAKVRNESGRTLRGLELRLSKDVVYKSKTFAGAEQRRTTKSVAERVRLENVPSGGQFESDALPLAIPSVPPRLAPKCRLIDISYSIELNCRSPPFCVSLPVVIGTIPLLPPKLRTNAQIVLQNNSNKANKFRRDDDEEKEGETEKEEQKTDEEEKEKKGDKEEKRESGDKEEKRESGDNLDNETERNCALRKRVRMPSSVLSELYPALSTPRFRTLFSGPVKVADERERKFHFGPSQFTPKYPFYTDFNL